MEGCAATSHTTAHNIRRGRVENAEWVRAMWKVADEVNRALGELALPESEIRKCGQQESSVVQQTAMEKFVNGNPRVWWLALKRPAQSFHIIDGRGYQRLREFIPQDEERCWFMPEIDDEVLPVFHATVNAVMKVLGECFAFEYYLVGNNFHWLLIENDHNEIIFSL